MLPNNLIQTQLKNGCVLRVRRSSRGRGNVQSDEPAPAAFRTASLVAFEELS
jgi:hypothetical protein